MNIHEKLVAALAGAACLLTTMAAPVSAAIFNFSYFGANLFDPTDTVTVNGAFTTGPYDAATNSYEIIDITGTRNGIAIDALLAPNSFLDNNNLLFADSFPLDEFGFAYTVGGELYNVIYSYDYIEIGYVGTSYIGYPLTSFAVKPVSVPEPSLMSGIVVIGILTGGIVLKRFYRSSQ